MDFFKKIKEKASKKSHDKEKSESPVLSPTSSRSPPPPTSSPSSPGTYRKARSFSVSQPTLPMLVPDTPPLVSAQPPRQRAAPKWAASVTLSHTKKRNSGGSSSDSSDEEGSSGESDNASDNESSVAPHISLTSAENSSTTTITTTKPDSNANTANNSATLPEGEVRRKKRTSMKAQWERENAESMRKLAEKAISEAAKVTTVEELIAYAEKFSNFLGTGIVADGGGGGSPKEMEAFLKALGIKCVQFMAPAFEAALSDTTTTTTAAKPPRTVATLSKLLLCTIVCSHAQKDSKLCVELGEWEAAVVEELFKKNVPSYVVKILSTIMTAQNDFAEDGTITTVEKIKINNSAGESSNEKDSSIVDKRKEALLSPRTRATRACSSPRILPSQSTVTAAVTATTGSKYGKASGISISNNAASNSSTEGGSLRAIVDNITQSSFTERWDFLVYLLGLVSLHPKASVYLRSTDQLYTVFTLATEWACSAQEMRTALCDGVVPPLLQRSVDKTALNYLLSKGAVVRLVACSEHFDETPETAVLTCEWLAAWLCAEAHAKSTLLLEQFTAADGYAVFMRCFAACEKYGNHRYQTSASTPCSVSPERALALFGRAMRALVTLTPCGLEDKHIIQKSAYNQHVIDANNAKFALPSFITNHKVLQVLERFLCSSSTWEPAQALVLDTVRGLYAENPLNMIAMERFRIMEHVFVRFDTFSPAIKREVLRLAVFKVVDLDWVPFEELTALNTLLTQSPSPETLYLMLSYIGEMASKSNALKAVLAETGVLSNLLVVFDINCALIKSAMTPASNTGTAGTAPAETTAPDEAAVALAKEKVARILKALTQLVTDFRPNVQKIREDTTGYENTLWCIHVKECRYAALGFWLQVLLLDTPMAPDNFVVFANHFVCCLNSEKDEVIEEDIADAAAAVPGLKKKRSKVLRSVNSSTNLASLATPASVSSPQQQQQQQGFVGDNPALIKMDILDMLCKYVSVSNANKDVFRDNGGFVGVAIILEKFCVLHKSSSSNSQTPNDEDSASDSDSSSDEDSSCDSNSSSSDSSSSNSSDDNDESPSSRNSKNNNSNSKLIEITNLFDGVLTLITSAILHYEKSRRYFTEVVRFDGIERCLVESGVLLKHPTSAARLLARLISLTTETVIDSTGNSKSTSTATATPSSPPAATTTATPSSTMTTAEMTEIFNPQAMLIGVRHLPDVPTSVALGFVASLRSLTERVFNKRHLSCSGLTGAVLDVLAALYAEGAETATAVPSAQSPSPPQQHPREALRCALLDLVVRLSENGTSCEDLHKLLRLVRKPRVPGERRDAGMRGEILEVLERVTGGGSNSSTSEDMMVPAILFDRTASGFSCAQIGVPDRSWPPPGGYSFSVWVYIEAYSAGEIPVLGFQIQDTRNRAVLALSPKGAPLFYVGDARHPPHTLGETLVPAGRWCHLVLVHPKALIRGVDSAFYVDGALVWTGRLPHMSSVSPPVTVTFNSLTLQPEPADGVRWRLGATYLFDRPIPSLAILTLYFLGPSFFKSTAAANAACLEEYQTLGVISSRNIKLARMVLPGWNPAKSLGPLYLGNLCGGSGSSGGGGGSNNTISVNNRNSGSSSNSNNNNGTSSGNNSSSGNNNNNNNSVVNDSSSDTDLDGPALNIPESQIVFCVSAQNESLYADGRETSLVNTLGNSGARVTLLGACQSVNPCSVPQCLVRVGGMAVALPLVARASTRRELLLALKIIVGLVRRSARNYAEMNALDGYQVLALHLREKAALLGEEHMRVLFMLAGFDPLRDPPEARVLANAAAFRSLFLALGVWRETGNPAFVRTVLATARDLVTKSDHAAFNAAQLRAVRSLSLLYMQLRDDAFPEAFVPQVFEVIEGVCLQVMAKDDLRHLAGFAMNLLPGLAGGGSGGGGGGGSAPSLPVVSLEGGGSNGSNSSNSSSVVATTGSFSSRLAFGSGNYRPLSPRAMCACNMALQTIYKILVSGHEHVARMSGVIHPFWVLHFISRRLNAETVGLALRILAVRYNSTASRKNKFAELFRKINGFQVLSHMLRPFSASPPIYFSLMCLMLAPDMASLPLVPQFDCPTLFAVFRKDTTRIAAPEVLPIVIDLFKRSYITSLTTNAKSGNSNNNSGNTSPNTPATSPSSPSRHARLATLAQQTTAAAAASLVRVPSTTTLAPPSSLRSKGSNNNVAPMGRQRGVSVSIPRPNFGAIAAATTTTTAAAAAAAAAGNGAGGGSGTGGAGIRGQQLHNDDSAVQTHSKESAHAAADLLEMQQTLGKFLQHMCGSVPEFEALFMRQEAICAVVGAFFPENKLRLSATADSRAPLALLYRALLSTGMTCAKDCPKFAVLEELVRAGAVPPGVSDEDLAAYSIMLVFDVAESIEMTVTRKSFAENETLSANVAAFCTVTVRNLLQGAFGPGNTALCVKKLLQFLTCLLNALDVNTPLSSASGLIKTSSTRADIQAIFAAVNKVVLYALQRTPSPSSSSSSSSSTSLQQTSPALVAHVLSKVIEVPQLLLSRANTDTDFFRAFAWCLFPYLAAEDAGLRSSAVEAWQLFQAYQPEVAAAVLPSAHKTPAGSGSENTGVAAAAAAVAARDRGDTNVSAELLETARTIEAATSSAYKAWSSEVAKQAAEGQNVVAARHALRESAQQELSAEGVAFVRAWKHFAKEEFKWATSADNAESRHFLSWKGDENDRQDYVATRWSMLEMALRTHRRCVWAEESFFLRQKWKLDFTETAFRMRPKFTPDFQFYKRYPYIPPECLPSDSQKRIPTSEDSKVWYETFDRAYIEGVLKAKSLASTASGKPDTQLQQGRRRQQGALPQLQSRHSGQLKASNTSNGLPGLKTKALAKLVRSDGHSVSEAHKRLCGNNGNNNSAIKVLGPKADADDADNEHDVKTKKSNDGDDSSKVDFEEEVEEEEEEDDDDEEEEEEEEEEEFTLEHKFQRFMEPGDCIQEAFNCEIADAMDTYPGVLLICTWNVYMIEGYKFCDVTPSDTPTANSSGNSPSSSNNDSDDDSSESGPRFRPRWASRRSSGSRSNSRGSGNLSWGRIGRGEQVVVEIARDEQAGLSSSFELKGPHHCNRWERGSICQAVPRRYALQWKALEIFVSGGRNHLLVFTRREEVDEVRRFLQQPPGYTYGGGGSSGSSGSDGVGGGGGGGGNGSSSGGNFMGGSSLLAVTGGLTTLMLSGGGSLPPQGKELGYMTQLWVNGRISNFLYLMYLNTVAGRTFNDLSQYPVFPWVVADYTSEVLDLSDPKTFRDLSKPIGALGDDAKREKIRKHFEDCKGMCDRPPYHYSQLYSSAAVVCYYLVRLEPFAKPIIDLNKGRFDVPDRLFFDVADTWHIISTGSAMQVMELIPEFYYLPEAFENRNRFVFGRRSNAAEAVDVDDVLLPPWAHGSAREFVRRNREALESPYASAHLHEWIDLIFGYKQRGPAAEEALNVFLPESYEGAVDIDAITDEIERRSKIEMIRNFGQVPQQLFTKPHPPKSQAALVPPPSPIWALPSPQHQQSSSSLLLSSSSSSSSSSSLSQSSSSSSALTSPKMSSAGNGLPLAGVASAAAATAASTGAALQQVLGPAPSILASVVSSNSSAGAVCAIRVDGNKKLLSAGPRKAIVMDPQRTLAYGTPDAAIKVYAGEKLLATVCSGHDGPVTAMQASYSGDVLVTGGQDTVVKVFRLRKACGALGVGPGNAIGSASAAAATSYYGYCPGVGNTAVNNVSSGISDGSSELGGRYRLCANLCGHFAPVTEVAFSSTQKIAVSGDKSGTCLLWDLNTMTLVRELPVPGALGRKEHIVSISIHGISGNIAVCTPHCVSLWTVNGTLLAHAFVPNDDPITACVLSPGSTSNGSGEALLTGHAHGKIRAWDTETFGTPQLPPPQLRSSSSSSSSSSENVSPALRIRTKFSLPDSVTALHIPFSDRTKLYVGTSKGSIHLLTDPSSQGKK